jgi:hypothetical protein
VENLSTGPDTTNGSYSIHVGSHHDSERVEKSPSQVTWELGEVMLRVSEGE